MEQFIEALMWLDIMSTMTHLSCWQWFDRWIRFTYSFWEGVFLIQDTPKAVIIHAITYYVWSFITKGFNHSLATVDFSTITPLELSGTIKLEMSGHSISLSSIIIHSSISQVSWKLWYHNILVKILLILVSEPLQNSINTSWASLLIHIYSKVPFPNNDTIGFTMNKS